MMYKSGCYIFLFMIIYNVYGMKSSMNNRLGRSHDNKYKMLKAKIQSIEEFQETYRHECYTALLNNGHILECINMFKDGGSHFIIIEKNDPLDQHNPFKQEHLLSWQDSYCLFKYMQKLALKKN